MEENIPQCNIIKIEHGYEGLLQKEQIFLNIAVFSLVEGIFIYDLIKKIIFKTLNINDSRKYFYKKIKF